jgi:HD superfamily phosphohydrolase YqeK
VTEEIINYVKLIDEDRQVKVLVMFTELWNRFSKAPASVKYHGSYAGGLLDHTLRVIKAARDLWELYYVQKEINISLASVTFCALVHDIGKIGDSRHDAYIPEAPGSPKFTYNKDLSRMDHELLTLYWLNRYGIQVNEEEMAAIYYHAGPYVEAYKKAAETNLLIILHTADNLTAKMLNI